jgi:hypothetical protein
MYVSTQKHSTLLTFLLCTPVVAKLIMPLPTLGHAACFSAACRARKFLSLCICTYPSSNKWIVPQRHHSELYPEINSPPFSAKARGDMVESCVDETTHASKQPRRASQGFLIQFTTALHLKDLEYDHVTESRNETTFSSVSQRC